MRIKAISLHQPWATLVSIGAKKFETRGWPTKHRGKLAIHAAQRWNAEQVRLCNEEPFNSSLREFHRDNGWMIDLGCVVAVCEVSACFLIDNDRWLKSTEPEFKFGNWSPGRYAWRLQDVRRVEPVPCKGRQGFFWVELPEAA